MKEWWENTCDYKLCGRSKLNSRWIILVEVKTPGITQSISCKIEANRDVRWLLVQDHLDLKENVIPPNSAGIRTKTPPVNIDAVPQRRMATDNNGILRERNMMCIQPNDPGPTVGSWFLSQKKLFKLESEVEIFRCKSPIIGVFTLVLGFCCPNFWLARLAIDVFSPSNMKRR